MRRPGDSAEAHTSRTTMTRHPSDRLLEARWRIPALAALHLAALVVLATWLWPPLRATWDRLDASTFEFLNAPLAGKGAWAYVWGIASMRAFDLAVALAMLAALIKGNLVFAAAQVRHALYAFIAILLLLLVIRSALFAPLVGFMNWQRASPSLTVKGAVLLSELFPGWHGMLHVKDSSGRAFPGDHASVLMLWAMFLSPFARGWRRWLVWGLACLFMLPRLVAGAHWLSDALVGGTFLALVTTGWGLCTPYAARACTLADRLATPLLIRLGRLPGLRGIGLLAGP